MKNIPQFGEFGFVPKKGVSLLEIILGAIILIGISAFVFSILKPIIMRNQKQKEIKKLKAQPKKELENTEDYDK